MERNHRLDFEDRGIDSAMFLKGKRRGEEGTKRIRVGPRNKRVKGRFESEGSLVIGGAPPVWEQKRGKGLSPGHMLGEDQRVAVLSMEKAAPGVNEKGSLVKESTDYGLCER